MTNFSREWVDELILPDGTAASSVADVDKYLRQNDVVLASDYSPEFYRRVNWKKQQQKKDKLFKEFISAYKRSVWKNGSKE